MTVSCVKCETHVVIEVVRYDSELCECETHQLCECETHQLCECETHQLCECETHQLCECDSSVV